MAKPKKGISDLIFDDLKKSLDPQDQQEVTQIHDEIETKFLSLSPKKKVDPKDLAKIMLAGSPGERELSRVAPKGATQFGNIEDLAASCPSEEIEPDRGQEARQQNLEVAPDDSNFSSPEDSSETESQVSTHDSPSQTEAITQVATENANEQSIAAVGSGSSFPFAPGSQDDPSYGPFEAGASSVENTVAHEGAKGIELGEAEVRVGISAKKIGALQDPWLQSNLRQAENLRIAQERVASLEREVHELRKENELLVTAAEFSQQKMEELNEKVFELERAKNQTLEQAQLEMNVYRENLFQRDKELERTKMKLEELEAKFQRDLNRVRVRERELENRLELTRAEKTALLASKDERILELKKKHDLLKQDLENAKLKINELQSKASAHHEQIARTIKTLRLALTHLESQSIGGSVYPPKRVE
jgi:hypothetical protein